jgi:hypothetical protein
MDRGRCGDVCGDRTFRRLRHVLIGSTSHVPLGNSHGFLQRSVWTGRRGSSRHGRQRVHVDLHNVDIDGSEGDRRRGILYDIPEGDELYLGECHHNRRNRPRTWDDQRNDQIPANYSQGSGTIVSGTTANKATEAALVAYPGGVVDRVVQLSNGEYEVHYIGVNWPHHIFVNQDFTVVGAN